MEKCWAAPELFLGAASENPKRIANISPLDYTFYPNRILGHAADSLFICESNSRRLKQVIAPHLIPVFVDSFGNLELIAADAYCQLAWDQSGSMLMRRSSPRSKWEQVAIIGTPVPSIRPPDEFWVQLEDGIELWKWPIVPDGMGSDKPALCRWIVWSAESKAEMLDLSTVQKSVEDCLAYGDEEIKLADIILELEKKNVPQEFVDGMSGHIPEFPVKCGMLLRNIHEALHEWCLQQLKLYVGGCSEMPPERSGKLEQIKQFLANQIGIRLNIIQTHILEIDGRLIFQTASSNDGASTLDSWKRVALISRSNLEIFKEWLAKWYEIAIP
jgi:hypothetical protein